MKSANFDIKFNKKTGNIESVMLVNDADKMNWCASNAKWGYVHHCNLDNIWGDYNEVFAQNYQKRVFYDKGLDANTEYTYTVTAETTKGLGEESAPCVTTTQNDDEEVSVSMVLQKYTVYIGSWCIFKYIDDFSWGIFLIKKKCFAKGLCYGDGYCNDVFLGGNNSIVPYC